MTVWGWIKLTFLNNVFSFFENAKGDISHLFPDYTYKILH